MHNDIIYSLKDNENDDDKGRDKKFYKEKAKAWSKRVEEIRRSKKDKHANAEFHEGVTRHGYTTERYRNFLIGYYYYAFC